MRTMEGLEAARSRGRAGGRKPKLSPLQVKELLRMVEAKEKTMAEIGELFGISPRLSTGTSSVPRPPDAGRSRMRVLDLANMERGQDGQVLP